MIRTLSTLGASLALTLVTGAAQASTWEVDSSHTAAQFSVRHLMVSNVRGEFSKVTGTVELDDKDVSKSKVKVEIDVSTVNTREPKRDEHLKSAEFFDVAKFPKMTFKSKSVTKAGGGFKVVGDLSIHGVTKEVTLDVEGTLAEVKDPWGNVKTGLTATTKIKREDFGLTWNKALEAGGVVVGSDVAITLDVELTKKK
ncbi:MAG: YceI family protein [Myxococcota bacterium]